LVSGELLQLPPPQQIRPRIPDLGDVRAGLVDQDGGERSPHAAFVAFLRDGSHLGICAANRSFQPLLGVPRQVRLQRFTQRADHDAAGDLTARVATHAVRQRE